MKAICDRKWWDISLEKHIFQKFYDGLRCPYWNKFVGWIFPKLLNVDISFFHSSLPYSRSLTPARVLQGDRELNFAHVIFFLWILINEPKTQSVTRVSKRQNCRKQKSMRFQTRRLFWRRGLFSSSWLMHDLSSTTHCSDDYIASVTTEASKENLAFRNLTWKA